MSWFRRNKNKTGDGFKETEQPATEASGIFDKFKRGLSKTRNILTADIDELFTGRLDDALLEELEERLITADVGVKTTQTLLENLTQRAGASRIQNAADLKAALRAEIVSMMNPAQFSEEPIQAHPHVIMVVGVNGTGKTTTIGKIARLHTRGGRSVLIGAADTFRAAAVEQLEIWAKRAESDFVRHKQHADPAAVAYDSVEAAVARNHDVALIDTAGRLHTRVNLMEELKKIRRTISRKLPGAPHEILQVLDATTGQNALSQARLFDEALEVTGLVLTKLDGTAKGGIVIGVCRELDIPLRYIGTGEGIDDLQPFDPERFADALFAES